MKIVVFGFLYLIDVSSSFPCDHCQNSKLQYAYWYLQSDPVSISLFYSGVFFCFFLNKTSTLDSSFTKLFSYRGEVVGTYMPIYATKMGLFLKRRYSFQCIIKALVSKRALNAWGSTNHQFLMSFNMSPTVSGGRHRINSAKSSAAFLCSLHCTDGFLSCIMRIIAAMQDGDEISDGVIKGSFSWWQLGILIRSIAILQICLREGIST